MQQTLINKVFKSFFQLLTGNVFFTVTSIVSGYFFALYLGPEEYGVWQTAFVISGYSVILMLSLPIVMRRDYIYLKKEGQEAEAMNMANIVFTYSLAMRIISTIFIVTYAYLFVDNILFRNSLYLVGGLFLIGIPTAFGNIMSKGLNKYGQITWQKVINGVGLLLTIPLVYFYGFNALLIGVFIANLAVSVYFYFKRPFDYKLYWDINLFKQMVVSAFPIFLVSITSIIFVSIDRLIIASMLSFKDVGLYSLSSFIASPLRLMVGSLSIVLFTQLNEEYGSKVNIHIIKRHVILPQEFFSKTLTVAMGIGIVALPYLVDVFLPQYQEGILAAQINIFAIYFFLLTNFSSNALFVLNKQKYTAISFLISGIIKVSLSVLLIKMGFNIVGVALSSVVAYLLYDVIMLKIVYKQIHKTLLEFTHHFAKIMLPATITLAYIIVLDYLSKNYLLINFSDLKTSIILELIFILLMSPYIYKAVVFVKSKMKK
ncbi:MAG: polysaccharide biosynthesis C-terminal domain-containing protein [Bacteroidales bacterium]|nr:polysaccharide biosynthesis C-terminal domain-containing protein [Bacteroidales bacterium]